jgi:DNA-binding transcriptional regulator YbjK
MSVKQIIQESIEKNPLGLKEALQEELSNRIRLALEAKINEETEELDEISRKTLGSYIDKASDSAADHAMKYGQKKSDADEMDRMMNRHMSYKDKDKVREIMKTTVKDVEEPREKAARRLKGISTAAKKLSGGAKINSNS